VLPADTSVTYHFCVASSYAELLPGLWPHHIPPERPLVGRARSRTLGPSYCIATLPGDSVYDTPLQLKTCQAAPISSFDGRVWSDSAMGLQGR